MASRAPGWLDDTLDRSPTVALIRRGIDAVRLADRARARRLLQVPEGHIILGPNGRAQKARQKARLMARGDDEIANWVERTHSRFNEVLLNYERHKHRAQAQGQTWQENARISYEYFESEVWVFAGVGARMRSAGSVRWEFGTGTWPNTWEPFENHLTRSILEQPNPDQSFGDLVEEIEGYRLLTGMALLDRGDRYAGDHLINSLWSIHPDALYPVGDETALITEWEYEDPYGQRRTVDAETIARFSTFYPGHARLGMGSVQPAGQAARELAEIREWSIDWFASGAEPKGVIRHPKKLHGTVKAMMRDDFARAHAKGSTSPMILDGGAEYDAPNQGTGRKGDYLDLRKQAQFEVLASLGVPPVLVGWEASTYATADVQQQVYWQNTMAPSLHDTAGDLNRQIAPMFGVPGLKIRPCLEDIPYMDPGKSDREDRWLEEAKEGLLSVEEYREKRGYGPKDESHTFYVPARGFGEAPVVPSAPAPPVEPEPAEAAASDDDDDDPDDGGGSPPPPPESETPPAPPVFGPLKGAEVEWTRETKAAHHGEFVERQDGYVQAFVDDFAPVWNEQRDRMISILEGGGEKAIKHALAEARVLKAAGYDGTQPDAILADVIKAATLDDLMEAIDPEDLEQLTTVLNRRGIQIMEADGAWALRTFYGEPGTVSIPEVLRSDWLKHSEAAMRGAQDTARRRALRSLAQGMAKGEDLRELRKRVERVYHGMTHGHAAMVARTESAAAQNRTIIETYKLAGTTHKAWLSMRDDRVRLGHQLADEEGPIPVNEPFMVLWPADEGGDDTRYPMMFPGDYDAPFGLTHNDRCTTVPARAPR